MKNMYRATRPAWALNLETGLIGTLTFLTIVLVYVHGIADEDLGSNGLKWKVSTIEFLFGICTLLATTAISLILLRAYKWYHIHFYPSTFIYCFNLPPDFNATSRTSVVGYIHIVTRKNGEISAEGASFDWEKGNDQEKGKIVEGSRTRFKSVHVGSSENDDTTTCHILYCLQKEDLSNRKYQNGLLQFKLNEDGLRAVVSGGDAYEGDLQSTNDSNVNFHAKGYAERLDKGIVEEEIVKVKLKQYGDLLFTMLKGILENDKET